MAVAITCGYGGYLLPLLAAHSSLLSTTFISPLIQVWELMAINKQLHTVRVNRIASQTNSEGLVFGHCYCNIFRCNLIWRECLNFGENFIEFSYYLKKAASMALLLLIWINMAWINKYMNYKVWDELPIHFQTSTVQQPLKFGNG